MLTLFFSASSQGQHLLDDFIQVQPFFLGGAVLLVKPATDRGHRHTDIFAVPNSAIITGKQRIHGICGIMQSTHYKRAPLSGRLIERYTPATEKEHPLWTALLKPYVAKVVVCDPRKNALLKAGNNNDRIDARKLADLLRVGLLSPVYHRESGVRLLKELARSYLAITKDLTRVQNRIKGLYRSWAIPCAGQKVYSPRHRTVWLKQLPESRVQRRAARLYQQLDDLRPLRREARQKLLLESRKHPASTLLRQIPWLGPIRVALLIAFVQTPHRFRTKRQLWAYSGLALRTRVSGEYRSADGQLQRAKWQPAVRGLNQNHNHELKALFKSTATRASTTAGPFGEFYAALLATGMRPTMARLTVARKIAAIVLTILEEGRAFRSGTIEATSSLSTEERRKKTSMARPLRDDELKSRLSALDKGFAAQSLPHKYRPMQAFKDIYVNVSGFYLEVKDERQAAQMRRKLECHMRRGERLRPEDLGVQIASDAEGSHTTATLRMSVQPDEATKKSKSGK